ncbi:MAG: hypothetical protein NWF06_08025 [Candidatus Bathyarchaeota archaeon]|nr:hypothetical protein [Candidatus Bathyarchaeum sp.]
MKNSLKRGLTYFTSINVAIILIVVLLFTAGIIIYAVNSPITPSFYLDNAVFKLGEDTRIIEVYVKVNQDRIELKQFFLNDTAITGWTADKTIIRNGETVMCMLDYPWKMGTYYTIKLVTTDYQSVEIVTKAPEISSDLQLETKNVDTALTSSTLTVNASYQTYSNGTDSLHVLLFTYSSFENQSRPAYIFYDPRYMPEESLSRADAIISYFGVYDIYLEKLDYGALENLANQMPSCILILINPLETYQGNRIEDAIPAPLVDPDGDGYIKDDSTYGKSRLYDWMTDNGLILVTVGSMQPYKRILYSDGTFVHAKDSNEMFDVHLFLTGASGEPSIINGSFVLGDYSPVKISGTLGLSYQESAFGFDKNALENNSLHYYAYADYTLYVDHVNLNLTLPAFIQVDEGGWLAMGDQDSWLSDKQLAHDLFMIYLQAVWDSEWIPYGWYWDSSCVFYDSGGELTVNGSLNTTIPSDIIDDTIVVRLLAISYSSDLDSGIIMERTTEHKIR